MQRLYQCGSCPCLLVVVVLTGFFFLCTKVSIMELYENEQEYLDEQASIALDEQQHYQDQKYAEHLESIEEVKTYVKVYLPEVPNNYYVATLEDFIGEAKEHINEGYEGDALCFEPIHITETQFQNLPDFTGF